MRSGSRGGAFAAILRAVHLLAVKAVFWMPSFRQDGIGDTRYYCVAVCVGC